MTVHFQRELDKIKKAILSLGALVEERVHMASKAIAFCDEAIAQKIINQDHEIDGMEVNIEEECLKILALYQPVAVDLRFLVAVIKINSDMERIGDQAVNIAQRVKQMKKSGTFSQVFDYSEMVEKASSMLRQSLDALVKMDVDMAFQVCERDKEVNKIRNKAYDKIKEAISGNPERVGYLLNLFLISRHLERVADHATNIAEEVIYLIAGEIIRHGKY